MKSIWIYLITSFLSAYTHVTACSCINDFQRIKTMDDLKSYEFIALVKVTSETLNPPSDKTPFRDATLGFKIIEKFKGKDIREVVERDVQSSCDMGIEVGDEWVLFATAHEGKLYISECNRNVRYRDKDGVRDWHYKRGFNELEDLHSLFNGSGKSMRDGVDKHYYPNGQVEAEITYLNGLKNGAQTVYHRNGKVWGKQMFLNDSLQGKSEWFFPSGQLNDQKFYRKNKLVNVSRVYYDTTVTDRMKKFLIRDFYKTEDSLQKTYRRIQVWLEVLYDYNGQVVASKDYSRWGRLRHEYFYHLKDDFYTSVHYHDNGQVHVVQHFKDYTKAIGHYQEYDPEGNPTKSWDYDENGKEINTPIPK